MQKQEEVYLVPSSCSFFISERRPYSLAAAAAQRSSHILIYVPSEETNAERLYNIFSSFLKKSQALSRSSSHLASSMAAIFNRFLNAPRHWQLLIGSQTVFTAYLITKRIEVVLFSFSSSRALHLCFLLVFPFAHLLFLFLFFFTSSPLGLFLTR
jgi:hypothetical protein